MKQGLACTFLCLVLVLTGCNFFKKETGTPSKLHQQIHGITNFSFEGFGYLLLISQDDDEFFEISTTKEAFERIEIKKEEKQLMIHVDDKKFRRPYPKITVTIQAKDIQTVSIASMSDSIKSIISLPKASKATINLEGSVEAAIRIDASELTIGLGGHCKAEVRGHVSKQQVSLIGGLSYNARELKSDECHITATDTVKAELNCAKRIEGTISGKAKITYIGKPALKVDTWQSGSIKPFVA